MGKDRHRRGYYGAATVLLLALVAGAAAGPIMSRVEQPEYKIETADGSIQIRSYGPMIAAEAHVEGERQAAIGQGFRLIAAYIFGANKPNTKISMTAPVLQQGTSIAMTAPVTQQVSGTSWVVRFIMPKTWTLDTLPAPNDPRVVLQPIPARRFVALTFSGSATDDAIRTRTEDLRRYVTDHKLATNGEPLLAFYNPPWTLTLFKRNEVMLELAD